MAGPVAFNVTVYVPGAEKIWVGFVKVDVSFAPDAGSPKFQLVAGQSADVFEKFTVVLFVQDQVKDALLGGASEISISSIAKPS